MKNDRLWYSMPAWDSNQVTTVYTSKQASRSSYSFLSLSLRWGYWFSYENNRRKWKVQQDATIVKDEKYENLSQKTRSLLMVRDESR
jgi:hypothetical protein